MLAQAVDRRDNGKIDEADALFSKIITQYDREMPFRISDVFRERGKMSFDQKLWSEAASDYKIYLELGKQEVQPMLNYARALRELNPYESALQVYNRLRQYYPNNYDVMNGLSNVFRRQGGFLQDANRPDAADAFFEKARQQINGMIQIAEKQNDAKKIKNALIARVRLNWQWRRYMEAEAGAKDLISHFPDYTPAKEDLSAILLEFGQKRNMPEKIEESKTMFISLIGSRPAGVDDIFIRSGVAEAVAYSAYPTAAEMASAAQHVLVSIANTPEIKDDPYPFYAAAVLFKRMKNDREALNYMEKAIHAERLRLSDPFTSDYDRLILYEKLKTQWSGKV